MKWRLNSGKTSLPTFCRFPISHGSSYRYVASGPSEESFHSLLKEIEKFKTWRKKEIGSVTYLPIPRNFKLIKVTCDSITLSWDYIDRSCVYVVEKKSLASTKEASHFLF